MEPTMAKEVVSTNELLRVIEQGSEAWNLWRRLRSAAMPINLEGVDLMGVNLCEADLSGVNLGWADLRGARLNLANLSGADLTNANFSNANLGEASLRGANLFKVKFHRANLYKANLKGIQAHRANLHRAVLSEADMSNAVLSDANLHRADLSNAILRETNLENAILSQANLRRADLYGADLSRALLVEAKLQEANLSSCRVYGVSAWDVKLENTQQSNLIITPKDSPEITVDNLEVAQFIYLLLNNAKIRDVIDQITSKVVLILGRFLPERKTVLDAVRAELRSRGYCPVLFDFDKPASRDYVETVCTLAHMARFVVADFTDAKIILEEVPHIVRTVAVPVKPLLQQGAGKEPVTLYNLRKNHKSVLETYRYTDSDDLMANLESAVIAPAEVKAKDLGDQ
jgi:uncharacterized protein YjbI with pentapeptide repeats